MLLRVVLEMSVVFEMSDDAVESNVAERCVVWMRAYDAAPEAIREAMTRSGMTNAFEAALANTALANTAFGLNVATPLDAFMRVTMDDRLSSDTITRLFQVLQRCGLFAAADRRDLALTLTSSASDLSPRAFQLLISDPNADAALPGPTRCSAGDAHNPPRHHSVKCNDKEVTLHVVSWVSARSSGVWRAFSDARLPFGARAMDEEWAYALTGPCGCAGQQRIFPDNALHRAIVHGADEAGEWLALRLPPKRLNEGDGDNGTPPLIAALRRYLPMPRTVAALLSRVPDTDLTLRSEFGDGKSRTAAELLTTRYAPKWLPSHLAAELQLKAQQFGAQHLPSAAALSAEVLFGSVRLPRELVNLVLQYTALPRPNSPAKKADKAV
jgi:hypothetical protein